MKIGYACINLTLRKQGITASRSIIKKTLDKKGWEFYNDLVIKNIRDLYKILKWNESMGIKAFRISNNLFSHSDFFDNNLINLDSYSQIKEELEKVGKFANDHDHRLSFHAEPYTILASKNFYVVKKSLAELNFLSSVLDAMDLESSPKHKVNIHIGTFNPSKEEAAERFRKAFNLLSENTKKRITIENDDSPNGFTVKDLFRLIYPYTKTPIVLDYFHHKLNPGNSTLQEVINLVTLTWGNIRPMSHFSSSKKLNEDESVQKKAHADYLHEPIPSDFADVIIEAKAKDLALLKYNKDFLFS